jgi:hypothetical protein
LREESPSKRDAIANCFLAFAAMMKDDYGISKEAAVLCIAAAYDTNAEDK